MYVFITSLPNSTHRKGLEQFYSSIFKGATFGKAASVLSTISVRAMFFINTRNLTAMSFGEYCQSKDFLAQDRRIEET